MYTGGGGNERSGILVLGCSFAYGHMLDDKQTFSYKLSEQLKRPVYNRAFDFLWGIHNAYYMLMDDNFYNEINDIDTIIYIYISDHINRAKGVYLGDLGTSNFENLRYKYINGKFKQYSFWSKNPLFNFNIIKTIKKLIFLKTQNNINDVFFCKKMFDLMRENAEKHYGNKLKFIILNYSPGSDDLIEELKKDNKYQVIDVMDLVNEDTNLFSEEYQIQFNDVHPNEKAWDLIVPQFIKEMNKK